MERNILLNLFNRYLEIEIWKNVLSLEAILIVTIYRRSLS